MSSNVYDWVTMADLPDADPELPRAVALAWGVAANPQRGPKREMSIERIVDAAVEIADAGGLSAVSMSSVASALGFTPMSLYRYVTSKDDLLVLMQERGIGVPPESVAEADGWRDAIRAWGRATVELYLDHPWLLDIPIEGTPQTPNNLAWMDAGLAALKGLPLDYEDKVSVMLAVMAQVRWQSTILRGYTQAAAAAGVTPDAIDTRASDLLAQLITPEEFPEVHAALAGGVFSSDSDADSLGFGLERVLDGIAAYLATKPARHEAAQPVDPADSAAERDPKYREAVKERREVEKKLREARKRERERLREARDRARRV